MNKDRTIVLGDGFLGNAFKRHGYDVWGRDQFEWGLTHLPLTKKLMANKYRQNDVDQLTIINCIGISNTRFCEDPVNWGIIKSVNGELPSWLSAECKDKRAKFIQISTGCVYDKKDGVVTEESPVASHCRYVVSKLIGEYGCNVDRDLIIRPRLLFDSERVEGKRNNLIQKFEKFDTFLNEFNSVTSLDTIVESVEALLDGSCSGVYNVCNSGTYTIAEMAKHLGFDVKGTIQDYELCKSQGLTLVNNVMSTDKLTTDTGYNPEDTLGELKFCYDTMRY